MNKMFGICNLRAKKEKEELEMKNRFLEYKIEDKYDGANVITVLKQHFQMSSKLIKDLKKYGRVYLLFLKFISRKGTE